jgi:hypothetical protein
MKHGVACGMVGRVRRRVGRGGRAPGNVGGWEKDGRRVEVGKNFKKF